MTNSNLDNPIERDRDDHQPRDQGDKKEEYHAEEGDHHHEQEHEEGDQDEMTGGRDDHHHLQDHHHGLEEDQARKEEEGAVSCVSSMHDRMPSPIVWASGGGDGPRTPKLITHSKTDIPIETDGHQNQDQEEDCPDEGGDEQVWVRGACKDDNERYKTFLKYMEDKREELRGLKQEDEERMLICSRRKESWQLLRLTKEMIREKEGEWRTRRLEECERIREEEKRDRLAVVAMKRKRYGVKNLSKEETMRLKTRKEERLEIAEAGSNLWKRMRKGEIMEEEGLSLWEEVYKNVINLQEEDDVWERDNEALRFSADMLKRSRLKLKEKKKEKKTDIKREGMKEDHHHQKGGGDEEESKMVSGVRREVDKIENLMRSQKISPKKKNEEVERKIVANGGGEKKRKQVEHLSEEERGMVIGVAVSNMENMPEVSSGYSAMKHENTGIFIGGGHICTNNT